MKKFAVLALSVAMVFSLAACGKDDSKKEETESTESAVQVENSLEILNAVWGTYGDEEKFSIAGGDYNNSVMDAPGAFDVSDTVALDSLLALPESAAGLIDDAASMMHMMNANSFTAGAYHVVDGASQDELVSQIKDNILGRQWMCGFPEKLVIVTIGDEYVVAAFGLNDFMGTFVEKLQAEYPVAEVVVEENLAE